MIERVEIGGLRVAKPLYDVVKDEIAPATGIDPDGFWRSFGEIVGELGPRNRALLERRDAIQTQIDAWHREHRGRPIDLGAYRAFLADIGYLVPEGPDFAVTTDEVDPEIATIAGPQLVVPVSNARYRAERRQRPLGQPLRRALRHRRHPRRGQAARARRRLQPRARRRGHRPCRRASSTRPRP